CHDVDLAGYHDADLGMRLRVGDDVAVVAKGIDHRLLGRGDVNVPVERALVRLGAGREPQVLDRIAYRLGVAVDGFVADAQYHGAGSGSAQAQFRGRLGVQRHQEAAGNAFTDAVDLFQEAVQVGMQIRFKDFFYAG